MKKCIAFIGAGILTAWTAAAADVPKVGVYLGYEYVRFDSATNVPAFSANGGGGQFIYNFNGWVGAVADVGAVHNGNMSGLNLDSTFTNFLFGPRISIRRSKRITPYFQVLWGGVYGSTSTQATVIPVATPLGTGFPAVIHGQPVTARLVASQTAFAMTAGGGLDIKISRHVSFRPIGLDYYLTRLQNGPSMAGDNHQNNLRYSAGVVPLWRREAYAAAGTRPAHEDLPSGRPRGELRCDVSEAGYQRWP
jgi:opacity protein-like surface antigen